MLRLFGSKVVMYVCVRAQYTHMLQSLHSIEGRIGCDHVIIEFYYTYL